MVTDKAQVNITKKCRPIEKLLKCDDVATFEKVKAEWATSKHWSNFERQKLMKM